MLKAILTGALTGGILALGGGNIAAALAQSLAPSLVGTVRDDADGNRALGAADSQSTP